MRVTIDIENEEDAVAAVLELGAMMRRWRSAMGDLDKMCNGERVLVYGATLETLGEARLTRDE